MTAVLLTDFPAALAATKGMIRDVERVAEALQVDADALAQVSLNRWAIIRQGVAALLDSRTWQSGEGSVILQQLRNLCIAEPDANEAAAPAFDAADCRRFVLPGCNDYGYYAGDNEPSLQSTAQVSDGLRLIESVGVTWIRPFIGAVVVTGDASDQHKSYSLRHTPCTIYTESFYGAQHAAETIVHEGAHNLLNLALNGLGLEIQLLEQPGLFYSPWRNQSRPAFGFLHAVFAFGHVYQVRTRLSNGRALDLDSERTRFSATRPQVAEILSTIGDSTLKSIFSDLYTMMGIS